MNMSFMSINSKNFTIFDNNPVTNQQSIDSIESFEDPLTN